MPFDQIFVFRVRFQCSDWISIVIVPTLESPRSMRSTRSTISRARASDAGGAALSPTARPAATSARAKTANAAVFPK